MVNTFETLNYRRWAGELINTVKPGNFGHYFVGYSDFSAFDHDTTLFFVCPHLRYIMFFI